MSNECYGYKKLNVWKKADDLAFQIFIATRNFPPEETYGITSQMRRAGLSVPTNIVEGYSRQGRKELKQFVNISMGSLGEVRYLLDFSSRLGYLNSNQYISLEQLGDETGKLLWRFFESLC
jgi:four helix bundle protein